MHIDLLFDSWRQMGFRIRAQMPRALSFLGPSTSRCSTLVACCQRTHMSCSPRIISDVTVTASYPRLLQELFSAACRALWAAQLLFPQTSRLSGAQSQRSSPILGCTLVESHLKTSLFLRMMLLSITSFSSHLIFCSSPIFQRTHVLMSMWELSLR